MCYTGLCRYEDHMGDCTKQSGVPCTQEEADHTELYGYWCEECEYAEDLDGDPVPCDA